MTLDQIIGLVAGAIGVLLALVFRAKAEKMRRASKRRLTEDTKSAREEEKKAHDAIDSTADEEKGRDPVDRANEILDRKARREQVDDRWRRVGLTMIFLALTAYSVEAHGKCHYEGPRVVCPREDFAILMDTLTDAERDAAKERETSARLTKELTATRRALEDAKCEYPLGHVIGAGGAGILLGAVAIIVAIFSAPRG